MFEKILKRIAEVFEKSRIEYMIIGGQAVLIYGEPRLTRDIDVTLGIGVDRLPEIIKIVNVLGWKVLNDSPETFTKKTEDLCTQ